MVQVVLCFTCIIFNMPSTSTTRSIPKDTSTALLVRVDQSGNGDFRKIQDAIDAVPSHNSEVVFIWVKPGTYRSFTY